MAIGWAAPAPPAALIALDPLLWTDGTALPTVGSEWGPFVASAVRPLERLDMGAFSLPLAINRYTGGVPDWPSRLLFYLTQSVSLVTGLHVAVGGALLVFLHRFTRLHATAVAAAIAALVLATDWHFVFYKKVLGGTEIALQFAIIMCIAGLWDRRWGSGRRGSLLLSVGIGLGLLAKLTFSLSLAALAIAWLATRTDRPQREVPRVAWFRHAAAVFLITCPLWFSAIHGSLATDLPPSFRSHDLGGLQLERVLRALQLAPGPVREGLGSLGFWAGDPVGFLAMVYGTEGGGWSWVRAVGWLLIAAGGAVAWRDRHPTPRLALLRFMTVAVTCQVLLLWLVARDMHHLAQATPTLALTAGLSLDALAGTISPRGGPRRALIALALAVPWMGSGVASLLETDTMLSGVSVPTFTETGQAELIALAREAQPETLVVGDYETYGVFETLAPDINVVHVWPAVSVARADAAAATLRYAEGQHLLLVQASAPMVYNLPSARAMQRAAEEEGLALTPAAALEDGSATIYRVDRQPASDGLSAAPAPD